MSINIEKIVKLALVVISLVLLGTVVRSLLPNFAHDWAIEICGGTMFPHQGQGFSLAENTLVLKMDEEAFSILEAACLQWIHTAYHLAYAGLVLLALISEGFLALTRWNTENASQLREALTREKEEKEKKEQELQQSIESLDRREKEIILLSNERDNLESELKKVALWQRSHEILASLQAGLASLQQPVTEASVTET